MTICSPGLNIEAVKEAVYKDFQRWNKEEGNSEKKFNDFMDEMYAMKVGEGNIFDIVKAMALPPISQEGAGSSALLENLGVCRKDNGLLSKRRKRSPDCRASGKRRLASLI